MVAETLVISDLILASHLDLKVSLLATYITFAMRSSLTQVQGLCMVLCFYIA